MATTNQQPNNEGSSLLFLIQFKDDFEQEVTRLKTLSELLALSNPENEDGELLNQFHTVLDPIAKSYQAFLNHLIELIKSPKTDPEKIAALLACPYWPLALNKLEEIIHSLFNVDDKKVLGRFWYLMSPIVLSLAELHKKFIDSLKAEQIRLRITDSYIQSHSGRKQVIAKENPDPARFKQIGISIYGNVFQENNPHHN